MALVSADTNKRAVTAALKLGLSTFVGLRPTVQAQTLRYNYVQQAIFRSSGRPGCELQETACYTYF